MLYAQELAKRRPALCRCRLLERRVPLRESMVTRIRLRCSSVDEYRLDASLVGMAVYPSDSVLRI